jgi:prepilin-type N-terminal cleavage/methylation domain-containing protein
MVNSILGTGSKRRHSGTHAFTLIELMTVMVVIVVLLSLVVGGWPYARRKALQSKTKADLQELSTALEKYRLEYKLSYSALPTPPAIANTYPYPTITGIDAQDLGDTAVTNFLDNNFTFLDAWGTNYVYEYDPSVSKETYRLWSSGGDAANPHDRIDSGG